MKNQIILFLAFLFFSNVQAEQKSPIPQNNGDYLFIHKFNLIGLTYDSLKSIFPNISDLKHSEKDYSSADLPAIVFSFNATVQFGFGFIPGTRTATVTIVGITIEDTLCDSLNELQNHLEILISKEFGALKKIRHPNFNGSVWDIGTLEMILTRREYVDFCRLNWFYRKK